MPEAARLRAICLQVRLFPVHSRFACSPPRLPAPVHLCQINSGLPGTAPACQVQLMSVRPCSPSVRFSIRPPGTAHSARFVSSLPGPAYVCLMHSTQFPGAGRRNIAADPRRQHPHSNRVFPRPCIKMSGRQHPGDRRMPGIPCRPDGAESWQPGSACSTGRGRVRYRVSPGVRGVPGCTRQPNVKIPRYQGARRH